MALAFIALGSNLGDRAAYLQYARASIAELGELKGISGIYETAPVGGPAQGAYLNQVVAVDTAMEPERLLEGIQRIERSAGRERRERWGPRTLDLDLLLYGDRVIESERLTVPHPRMHERRFVLSPLADLAPNARNPVHGRTIRELLDELPDRGEVVRWRAPMLRAPDGCNLRRPPAAERSPPSMKAWQEHFEQTRIPEEDCLFHFRGSVACEDGSNRPLEFQIGRPRRTAEEFDHCCVVWAPTLRVNGTKIHGVDDAQASELSFRLVAQMIHGLMGGRLLMDESGAKVSLPFGADEEL
ncbi:MAG: 2-amino-4-hydroxy-6-hydroxymethyldihydropteridine diphosphokinase [Myxococcales bacterium]|nr:2-amino-4-hydroxy-6-hydroxymethyldihydropteridine diphosphokinase [Myxococcales bacterium]